MCEKWVETRTDCSIDPVFISRPYQHFFFIVAGVAQPGVTEDRKVLSLQAGSQAGILSPTDSNRPGTWLYYFLTYTCFRCSSTYLYMCISWLTARLRVNIQQSSHSFFSKFHMWTFSSHPFPPSSHTHLTNNAQGQQPQKYKKKLLEQQQNTKFLIRRRPSHYVTLAQANYYLNLFHTILCAVGYPDMRASKHNTDASFILPNTIGPSAILEES